jgi:flagellar hook-associated protein 2
MRLEKKEETLRNRFNALEQLVSGMNTQSTFLTQQFDLLNNMMTRK